MPETQTPEELLAEAVRLLSQMTSIVSPIILSRCAFCGTKNEHYKECDWIKSREFVRKYKERGQ